MATAQMMCNLRDTVIGAGTLSRQPLVRSNGYPAFVSAGFRVGAEQNLRVALEETRRLPGGAQP